MGLALEGLEDAGISWWGQSVTASPPLSARSPKGPPLCTGMAEKKQISASLKNAVKS